MIFITLLGVLIIVANLLDAITTYICLKGDGSLCGEKNPVMAWLMAQFAKKHPLNQAIVFALVIKFFFVTVMAFFLSSKQVFTAQPILIPILLVLLVAGFSYAAYHNYKQIEKKSV